jgi:hypothetical protein
MARKKTVSISRKPSAEDAAPEDSGASANPSPLAMTLQPYAEILEDEASPLSLGPVGKVVYGTVFCLSYGVVFGAILLGQFIPGSRVLGHALQDGAASARRSFEDKPGRRAKAALPA